MSGATRVSGPPGNTRDDFGFFRPAASFTIMAMTLLRRLCIVTLALFPGALGVFAAGNAKEERAFSAAASAFQARMWSRAETEFGQFVERYPKSTNAPQAVLLQAQARFQQKKFPGAISLLRNNQVRAKNLEDQYVYWIGESQFADSNFTAAAETFVSLGQNFPASPLRTGSIVEAAAAWSRLQSWPTVESLLTDTNGAFQRAVQADPNDEMTLRGSLLLAQARFEQDDFDGAVRALDSVASKKLPVELQWQRDYLLCRTKMAAGDLGDALAATTNLMETAQSERDDNWRAETTALRGELFQKSGQPDEAIAVYKGNLKSSVPVEYQREAMLKVAEILMAQNQLTNAGQSLEAFLQQFGKSSLADMALLTLGELHLKNYGADHTATNELQEAQGRFTQFIGGFTNSPLLGKAYLRRGWCYWFTGRLPESLADFKAAVQKLPPSDDLAIARFKAGDAWFAQAGAAASRTNDAEARAGYVAARANYDAVLDLTNVPAVAKGLADRALYQSMRASLEVKDLASASNSLAQLLRDFPESAAMPNAELLYGEGLADIDDPAAARVTFEKFEKQWPNSPLQPQVEYAVAHTYELQRDWSAAVARYQEWLAHFPTNQLVSRVSYFLAWASFQAGDETNALVLFNSFTTQFPTNGFAPQARWWIADHFYRAGEFVAAETNYESVYQTWPASDLAYPARLMTGRAAVGRQGYKDAIHYFADMINDTNCPSTLNVQAQFALGNTLMSFASPDQTNAIANFSTATNVFNRLILAYPGGELAVPAQVKIADCDLQMNNYDAATNLYAAVLNATNAALSLRSEAQVGLGLVLEKKAELATAEDKKRLQRMALQNYLDVFYQNNQRDGEDVDPFWIKKAGLQALPLVESLGTGDPNKFVDQMESWLPQLKDSLEKRRTEFLQIKS